MKKYCYKCKNNLSIDLFYKNEKSKDGLFKVCKKCARKREKEKEVKNVLKKSILLVPELNETFKAHSSGLLVSTNGRVFMPESFYENRVNSAKFVKGSLMKNGYYCIRTGGKSIYTHRLVAETFLKKPIGKNCVNHKDLNKLNNKVCNLEWCSNIENLSHAHKNDSFAVKLNREQVLKIREEKKSVKQLSIDYNVSETNIRLIINRKIWKHV